MNKFVKNIGFYLILIAISILVAQFFMQQGPTTMEDFTYTNLLQEVESDNINEVTIIGNQKVTGTIDNRSFNVPVPPEAIPSLMQELRAGDVNIKTEPQPTTPWWINILSYILPVVILIVAWIFIMQKMQGGGSKMMSFGKSKAKLNESDVKVTFDDVANYDEVKEELQEVIQFLQKPDKFTELGAEVPKGVLMVGPPGTGKTLMAKAVAGEAGVPFFFISGSDFVEMFVGVGASRVRDLFEKGKKNAPCIIFIDELDAVGRQRGAGLGGGHDEREQTLNQLLVEMDGFEPNEGIILMAATNRPDVLDPALLRPGRFDRQVMVDKPDRLGRQKILEIHVKNKPLGDDIDLEVLAKRTPGFTGADMENLANEAAILAARRSKKIIAMKEFDDAIDRVIAGPARKSKVVTEEEKNLVSYHETGHALLGELLEHADRTHKVTIIPRGRAGGFTVPLPSDDQNFMTKGQLLDKVTSLMGGRAAEAIFLDDISTGAQNDIERATKIIRAMVTEYGMSENLGPLTLGQKHDQQVFLGRDISRQRNYSEEVAARIDKEISKMVEECYSKAERLLRDNSETVEKIVKALKEYETLHADQIKRLMRGEEITGDPDKDRIEESDDSEGDQEKEESIVTTFKPEPQNT
ncbi:cell division protease FtsH [Halanaerobium saccharolyticum]|uniref:ATP-dependent zinc metalloprotease FtsH n=1 Tax=Halanaerobium saccharolyticum TaxID=43595 RepID=A0A4R7YPU7_9FIRM|nr:ATP-dependent zinc metalloprotease FtsH [Halanaerobium saccharolyticum]RAK05118.1 cell division protease FtsH [Halanaerobium saccharolyticum]TDV98885.1 cell division protease FtsH [Halanaerobium saccharolyticum]TDX51587.1 cell division protease FtsH [Halanaerobium saccharolyticum]